MYVKDLLLIISSTLNNTVCSSSKWLQKKNKWLQKKKGGSKCLPPPSEFASAFIGVTVLPPQESQEATMFFCNLHLVEHSLYVCHYSNMFFSKSDKYSNKLICEVRTCQKIFIYWFPTNFCWTVKYHSDFARFVGIEGNMMRYILSLSQWIRWYLFLSTPFC